MQRVFLIPYDPEWSDEFARESIKVSDAIGSSLIRIHHIGSTAIPGIHAKPIIDMLAEVGDLFLLDKRTCNLEAIGYEALGEFGIPARRYFRKNSSSGIRTHQVHAFETASPQVERHLAFRDFMCAHPDYARDYEALKIDLASQFPGDIGAYTDGKDAFIKRIDNLATEWRKDMRR